ncbi:MAG: sensor histidine kinase [Crocinitomicaceae bacterium]|nr:sensor histidine kinase [Crocinitomicaceae bacterium]
MKLTTSIILLFSASSLFSFETNYADSMFEKAKEQRGKQAINFMLDNFFSVFIKNHEDGTRWMQTCLTYSRQTGDKKLIGRSHLSLGTTFYMRGDYPQCLENYQTALDIFEALNDKSLIGRTCNEFSVYWRKQKLFEKGLEYLDRSYQLCTECKDTGCVETSLNNRAVIYEMMGRYDDAIRYYKKAEDIAVASNNQTGLAYIYTDCAECYRLKGNSDSSMIQINRSIEIMSSLQNFQGLAMNLINKAALFAEEKRYDEAIATYLECIELSEKLKYTDLQKNAHAQLGKAYAESGDFEKSFYHMDRSAFLHDSIMNVEKIRSLSEMEVKYETEKIENDLLAEKQVRTESELKLANRNKWLIGLGGFFTASIFLVLFLYQRKSSRAKAEKDEAIIAEREKGIQAVFDATEEERQRIAKDLHDGIGQQMSGLKLAWQNLTISSKNLSEEEKNKLHELSKILDSTAADVRDISHRMMPKVLEAFGLVPAIEEMLEKSFKLSEIKYEFEHYNFDQRLPKKTEIALFRICQELINNVIKHANANFVSIQLFKNQNQLILIVEDNGKGIQQNEKQDGHGLLNIKSRLNTINGQVNYAASENAGTTATIRVLMG